MTDKTLDLLVRTQIKGGKDLDGVAKSIANIGTSIEEQSKAAAKGENTIDSLKASLAALDITAGDLKGFDSAVKTFTGLRDGVAKAEQRVGSATKKYQDYFDKLEKAGKRTDDQQAKLIKYSEAVQRAEKSLQSQKDALTGMQAEFAAAGLSVDQLAAAQERARLLQAELGVVYQQNKVAIQGYAAAVREARAAEQARLALGKEEAQRAAAQAKAALDLAAAQDRAAAGEAERLALKGKAVLLDQQAQAKAEAAGILRDAAAVEEQRRAATIAEALKKQANAAKQTAREYTTLARAADSLTPKQVSLRESISAILDPAAKTRATLQGLQKEVGDLASGVARIKGPVTEYRDQVDRLVAAQKSLGQQASLIDNFNRQVIALRAARAEFVQNRTAVSEYAAKVAQGGDGTQQFVQKLAQAQTQLKASAQALAQQVSVTRDSRGALQAAGIASNDLAGAQRRLNETANLTVTTMKGLTDATERYGQSVTKTTKAKSLFRDEGRTTLSLMQRIRGEVLSLAAAYGGLFAVIGTAKGAIQSTVDRQAIESRIAVAIGDNDVTKIGQEYAYLRERADYYGIGLNGLATSYGSYAVAAKSAQYTDKQTKYTFEQLTAAMRVMKLNTDQQGRAFTQVNQILSKTKPEMEDIKTIAESGFAGVQGLMARGLLSIGVAGIRAGKETGDMFALMKKGALDSNTAIYALAVQAEKELGGRVPEAIKSLTAEQGRFETSLFEFQQKIAESGWAEAYKNTLMELSKLMASEDGTKAAKALGEFFTALAKALIWTAQNGETVKNVLIAIGVWYGQGVILKAISDVKGWAVEFGRLAVVVQTTLIPALAKAGYSIVSFAAKWPLLSAAALTALGVIGAAFVGWQIGKWAREKFQIVRDAGIWMVTRMMEAFAYIRHSFSAALDVLPEVAKRAFAKVIETISSSARDLTHIFATLARAAGFDQLGASLDAAAESMKVATRAEIDVLSGHKANLKAELAQIAKIRGEMLNDSAMQGSTRAPAAAGVSIPGKPGTTTRPDGRPVNPLADTQGAAGAQKLQNEIEAITKALEGLEARTDRAQTDTLATQIDAIETQYLALARRIEKIGGDTGKAFMERLKVATGELKRVVTDKFNKDLLDAQQAMLKKTEDAEEQAGRGAKLKLDARLGAIISDYDQAYRELADLRTKFVANDRNTAELGAMAERLRVSKEQRLEQERTKFNTEELNRREQLLNDTIAARDKLLAAVNTQKEVGAINDVEAANQLNAVNADMVPKIEAAAQATRDWALANSSIFANPETMQVFLATLDAVRAKAVGVKTEFSLLQQTIQNGVVNGINTSLGAMADALQGIVTGQQSISEGFKGMLNAFGQFVAGFLRDIALMILKMMIFKALQGMGGGFAAVGNAGMASMGVKHDGGVIGSNSKGNRTRTVSPTWFANAPRYHQGGIGGLAPDEYPTILQAGEEVLKKDSPRNILNGGAGIGGAQQGGAAGGMRVVLVDERSRVPEAMSGADGERVIVQAIRRNIPTLRQMLK